METKEVKVSFNPHLELSLPNKESQEVLVKQSTANYKQNLIELNQN